MADNTLEAIHSEAAQQELTLTWDGVDALAAHVAQVIHDEIKFDADHRAVHHIEPIHLYGIPRGGIYAAMAVARALEALSMQKDEHGQRNPAAYPWNGVKLIDNPQCDLSNRYVIDDLIDSGETIRPYLENGLRCRALIAKTEMQHSIGALRIKPGMWVKFPWEAESYYARGNNSRLGLGSDGQGRPLTGAEDAVVRLLQLIGQDPKREGLRDTPARVCRALKELTAGYGVSVSDLLKVQFDGKVFYSNSHSQVTGEVEVKGEAGEVARLFPRTSENYMGAQGKESGAQENDQRLVSGAPENNGVATGVYDELVILRKIRFTSLCEHHMLPFTGHASVGYLPRDKVVGLSKLARLVDAYARRLQIQERMTAEIAEAMMTHLNAQAAGVVVSARHACMGCRGAMQPDADMVTSAMLGRLRVDPAMRAEFLRLIAS